MLLYNKQIKYFYKLLTSYGVPFITPLLWLVYKDVSWYGLTIAKVCVHVCCQHHQNKQTNKHNMRIPVVLSPTWCHVDVLRPCWGDPVPHCPGATSTLQGKAFLWRPRLSNPGTMHAYFQGFELVNPSMYPIDLWPAEVCECHSLYLQPTLWAHNKKMKN